MAGIADDELRRHLQVNRDPLVELGGDEHCWRLGPVELRKNEAAFRVGYGHPALTNTRFLLQPFDLDGNVGTAVVLLSGGKPPHYFGGWVPVGREIEAARGVETLNATLRRTTGALAATTSTDLAAADAILFELGNENAPDSPYGLQRLTLTRAGRLTYEQRRAGSSESREGYSLLGASTDSHRSAPTYNVPGPTADALCARRIDRAHRATAERGTCPSRLLRGAADGWLSGGRPAVEQVDCCSARLGHGCPQRVAIHSNA